MPSCQNLGSKTGPWRGRRKPKVPGLGLEVEALAWEVEAETPAPGAKSKALAAIQARHAAALVLGLDRSMGVVEGRSSSARSTDHGPVAGLFGGVSRRPTTLRLSQSLRAGRSVNLASGAELLRLPVAPAADTGG